MKSIMNLIYLKWNSKIQQIWTLFQRHFNLNDFYNNCFFMLELINKWVALDFCLCYPRNAVSETSCLCMFDDNKRKLMYYCTITLFPRQVSLFSFSNIWLLPWTLLDCFFPRAHPSLVFTGSLAPGPSWLLSSASATITISFSLF